MGMSSSAKKSLKQSASAEVEEGEMDMRKMVAVDEKYITRSYFKEDKSLDPTIPPKRNPSKNSLNKLGKQLAEVFRTDFITAMKIPETQQLPPGEYLTLKDTWRQEWEKGVQVPVNPEASQKTASCRKINIQFEEREPFLLPDSKIAFDQDKYNLLIDRSKTSCNYDLDGQDIEWLNSISSLRTLKKASTIDELSMERAITWFERECFDKMAHAVATKEGLSIEYDESTTCNVCLSPDAEDGNEIIFCDACMMCAHQHCYGVLEIPEGTWLCNPCSRGILSPPCCLCPNKGGAMKRIKDSFEWIHVICAWWVPEVKIEDVKYIERITKDAIPASRWNLSCSICRDKMGACIQCTEKGTSQNVDVKNQMKRCVRAYHVTCAVSEGLEMKTVVIPEKNDVQHLSFCSKHCNPVPPDRNPNITKSEDIENNRITELRKLESEFYTLVSVQKAMKELKMCKEATRRLLSYWTMKRRANENAPLINLTMEQQEKLSGKKGVVFIAQQKTLEMERFLHLRQDLERLRNLCYMIVRREKVRKEVHRTSMEVFYKQNDILLDRNEDLSGGNLDFIRHRTTRFTRFSENYQTIKEYEEEHDTRVTIFDSTLEEEGEDMLNSSQFEKINLDDLQRVVGVRKSKGSKGEAQHSKNEIIDEKEDITLKSESDRNIFELLEPDEDIDIEKTSTERSMTSSPNRNISSKQNLIDPIETSIENIDVINIDEDEKPSNKTPNDQAPKLNNAFLNNDEKEKTESLIDSNDVLNTSRLVKKGKKRFRNLHKMGREACRNSPRLRRINSEDVTETKTEVLDPDRLSKIISEAKRRRLNSSGDYVTEYEEEPPDYVRVTRSRVASCS